MAKFVDFGKNSFIRNFYVKNSAFIQIKNLLQKIVTVMTILKKYNMAKKKFKGWKTMAKFWSIVKFS